MKILYIIGAIFIYSLHASAADITAYVCDTCGEQGAQVLARTYAPPEQCYFSNSPGTIATPEDRVCTSFPRELIIVNPITKQAFKYRTQLQCYGSWCETDVALTSLSLTHDEQDALATYYDIDSSMRNRIGQMNEMIAMSIQGSFSTFSTANIAQQCSANPMEYFTNPTSRQQIENDVREKIKQKVGSESWSEYITTNYIGPSGFTIGRQTANVSFDRTHVSYPIYERHFLGNTPEERNRNNLNFRVDYIGRISDQPGLTTWGIRLSLDTSTSWVDGHVIGNLTPNGGTVNMGESLADMPCFNEYIENQDITTTPVSPGTGGGSGGNGSGPGTGGSGGGDCRATTSATVCSTTADGTQTCSVTIYHFRTVC